MAAADQGSGSVGYDQYDRFDLGTAASKTLYGTDTGARQAIAVLHRAGTGVTMDLIWNHNGFSGTGADARGVVGNGNKIVITFTEKSPNRRHWPSWQGRALHLAVGAACERFCVYCLLLRE